MSKEPTAKEKSRLMIEAIKFCLEKGLMTAEELRKAQSPKEKAIMGMEALFRMGMYKRAHPQEE